MHELLLCVLAYSPGACDCLDSVGKITSGMWGQRSFGPPFTICKSLVSPLWWDPSGSWFLDKWTLVWTCYASLQNKWHSVSYCVGVLGVCVCGKCRICHLCKCVRDRGCTCTTMRFERAEVFSFVHDWRNWHLCQLHTDCYLVFYFLLDFGLLKKGGRLQRKKQKQKTKNKKKERKNQLLMLCTSQYQDYSTDYSLSNLFYVFIWN